MTELIASVTLWIIELIDGAGYAGIFLLMALEGSFFPVPSEIILPFSGYLVSQGRFSLWMVALIGALGNIAGTLFTYFVARYLGLPFLYRYGKFVLVTKKDIEQATELFRRFGTPILFVSRLLPGIRGFVPIPAGISKMKLIPFVAYVFVGSFLWSLFLTYIGVIVGENWEEIGKPIQDFSIILLSAAGVLILWWVIHRIYALRKEF